MSNDNTRLIIFLLLSGAILFFYNYFFLPKPVTQKLPENKTTTPVPTISPKIQTKVGELKNKVHTEKFISPIKEEKEYILENNLIKITFSSFGAVIKSYILKNYSDKIDKNKNNNTVELIPNKHSYSYLLFYNLEDDKINNSNWNIEKIDTHTDTKKIIFSREIEKGIFIYKDFTITNDSYVIKTNIKIINKSKNPYTLNNLCLSWGPNIHFLPHDMEKYKAGMGYQYQKILYETQSKQFKILDMNLKTKETKTIFLSEPLKWIALKDIYFMSSFIPQDNENIEKFFYKENAGGFIDFGLILKDKIIDKEKEFTFSIDSYIGPQEYKRLKKLKMDKVVDLGWSWLRPISILVFYSLDFLYNITKNYGVAIILLTLIIRLLLWIPSQNSYKHMKDMQKKMNLIKPRMETLKKVYKDDPQKLNEEMMKLYREYKINPFGGCLPLLLQLPIFFALYATLINMVELKGAYFMLWLKDLSAPDPYFVLPILMGVTMLIQQLMVKTPSPSPEAEVQQKILTYGLPIFLTFLAFGWPSGLLLYWSVSNIFSIIQQFFVNKANI